MSGTYGFTGTRYGMSDKQKDSFTYLMQKLRPDKLVHGMAKGADTEANRIARSFNIRTKGWPASPHSAQFCQVDEIEPVKPPLERDEDIAREGVYGLIACPYTEQEEVRSGTWATVRRARKLGRKIIVIKPDGEIDHERKS